MSPDYRLGPYYVCSQSIAGNETFVYVKVGNMHFGFDIGTCPTKSINCENIFISHAHIDHIGAIAKHMRLRQLNRLPKSRYFVPAKNIESVYKICKEFASMHEDGAEDLFDPIVVPVTPGDSHELSRKWRVAVFKTDHSIESVGYIFHFSNKNFSNLPSIAYTGDTRFSIYKTPAHPDLLKVQLLITEATFIDNYENSYERCHKYGHTHIDDIFNNPRLFKDIKYIHLIHFSDRYSIYDIKRICIDRAPILFKNKIFPSYWAKLIQSSLKNSL